MTDEHVARLERRLARERAAREEAERIAEKGLRELYLVNRDLDELVARRTAELEGARSAASRSDAARSEFLRVLSRELRTPLNGVLGMVELLHGRVGSEQERVWASSALASADALNDLVTRLLLYVDLDRPHPSRPEQICVSDLVARLAAAWERPALQAGKLLVVDDRSDPEDPAYGYMTNVQSLFGEILDNVVEHAQPGPLRIEAETVDGVNAITVSDSGPGFAGADRLMRVDELAPSSDGLRGVGYALVTKLAARTRASVSVDSAPGSPTRVRVELAQAAAFADDAPAMSNL